MQVIKGAADAYVHVTQIKKWDICAGNAIIMSVKGRMTTLEGRNIDYSSQGSPVNDNGLLATLSGHEKLLDDLRPVALDAKNSSGHRRLRKLLSLEHPNRKKTRKAVPPAA